MLRKRLRARLPKPHELRARPSLARLFGVVLHDSALWHLNRQSVAWAVSVGLFMAFMPVPFQMVLAAAAAIVIGCNLPVAVVTVWVSNPVTMPPLLFASYKLGAWLLGSPASTSHAASSMGWLAEQFGTVWRPLLLGSVILGLVTAIAGHVVVRLLWRLHVARSWRLRLARRRAATELLAPRAEPPDPERGRAGRPDASPGRPGSGRPAGP